DRVRVVSVPGFSLELCGGTHVAATGDIGLFVVAAESGVAAGVRRIEALTGMNAVGWAQQQRSSLQHILSALHATEDQAVEAIERLQAEARKLSREVSQLKTKLAMAGGGDKGGYDVVETGGVKLARAKARDLDKDALRNLADSMKAAVKSGVVLVTSANSDGKVAIAVSVTPDLVKRIAAGKLVKELAPIVGGGGGGRPDFAEAGGKDASRIDALHDAAPVALARLLGA
ncbi:MAG: DHHA1 domain-containing protein, partial [Vicinamibacterales bacterium]